MFWNKRKLSHYEKLSKKWVEKHAKIQTRLWEKHGHVLQEVQRKTQQFAMSSLAGAVMLLAPVTNMSLSQLHIVNDKSVVPNLSNQQAFLVDLASAVPQEVRPLSPDEEKNISEILSKYTGFVVTPELQGMRLNSTYGYIGKEQHLARYPGDTIANHIENPDNTAKVLSDGMAPGLGGWGYFATSSQMTQEQKDREKYYIAVQTFLAPGYSDNVAKYSTFFKWRKMLVVNPQNGQALVADIGDAGPAVWTGKQLGGSPEVMDYLQRVDGKQKGPVLYFFIDDPENKVPLGPVQL